MKVLKPFKGLLLQRLSHGFKIVVIDPIFITCYGCFQKVLSLSRHKPRRSCVTETHTSASSGFLFYFFRRPLSTYLISYTPHAISSIAVPDQVSVDYSIRYSLDLMQIQKHTLIKAGGCLTPRPSNMLDTNPGFLRAHAIAGQQLNRQMQVH